MCKLSTHQRGELKTFLLLIQLEDWQAVHTESGGDFAAVMDVMFEHTPDDPLERNGELADPMVYSLFLTQWAAPLCGLG